MQVTELLVNGAVHVRGQVQVQSGLRINGKVHVVVQAGVLGIQLQVAAFKSSFAPHFLVHKHWQLVVSSVYPSPHCLLHGNGVGT